MKTLKYILSFCAIISFSSCDDFLTELPQTSVEQDGVYNSLSSAKAALSGCYATMAEYNYFGYNYFHLLNTSSALGVSLKTNDVNMTSLNIMPSDINISNTYNAIYATIRVANDIIDGMATSTINIESEKNRIVGEAMFIRGMCYFNLVRLFGKLSLVTKPVTNYEEAQQPRTNVEEVYDLIIGDLIKATELLPSIENRQEGYPHKYTSQALLSKVYLTLAGDEEESEYWQLAYNAALDVYNNANYELVRPYAALFGSPNKNNRESIFEIQFSSDINAGRMTETTFPVGHLLMSNIITEGKSWGKSRPTQRAFDMFDDEDPRLEASFVYRNYVNIFETNESKKTVILYPTQRKVGTNKEKWTYKQGDSEYAAWKKYYDPSMTASATNANFVYMRYADVLFILAESANELGLPDASTYLSEILDRARDLDGNGVIDSQKEIYPLPLSEEEANDKVKFRERVFRERLKEFTGECDEWYTIRRRGEKYLRMIMEEHNLQIDDWYNSQNITSLPKFVYKYNITDETVKKNLLLPFPSDEINRNENISQEEQNYGY